MNTTMITGRLTRDASLGQTKNGTPKARMTIASDKKASHAKGEPSEANFIPVEIYGKKAEAVGEYLKKGKAVAVWGTIQTSTYKNSEGKDVYTWSVVDDKIEFLPEGAMSGINDVTMVGRLTADARTSYTKDGTCVLNFTVASDRHDKEKKADFIPVVLYGKLGESLGRFLAKGKSVAVIGRIDTGSYKNSEGVTVDTWRIVASDIRLNGDGKKKTEEPAGQPDAQMSFSDEESGFIELPPEFDEEYFDDEEF